MQGNPRTLVYTVAMCSSQEWSCYWRFIIYEEMLPNGAGLDWGSSVASATWQVEVTPTGRRLISGVVETIYHEQASELEAMLPGSIFTAQFDREWAYRDALIESNRVAGPWSYISPWFVR